MKMTEKDERRETVRERKGGAGGRYERYESHDTKE